MSASCKACAAGAAPSQSCPASGQSRQPRSTQPAAPPGQAARGEPLFSLTFHLRSMNALVAGQADLSASFLHSQAAPLQGQTQEGKEVAPRHRSIFQNRPIRDEIDFCGGSCVLSHTVPCLHTLSCSLLAYCTGSWQLEKRDTMASVSYSSSCTCLRKNPGFRLAVNVNVNVNVKPRQSALSSHMAHESTG